MVQMRSGFSHLGEERLVAVQERRGHAALVEEEPAAAVELAVVQERDLPARFCKERWAIEGRPLAFSQP